MSTFSFGVTDQNVPILIESYTKADDCRQFEDVCPSSNADPHATTIINTENTIWPGAPSSNL